jgi:excisionase family DNA binding protein
MAKLNMESIPSREDRKIAQESLDKLLEQISTIKHQENVPQITIQESAEPIKIPYNVLKLLADILENIRDGNALQIVPHGMAFTTQKAAEFLNCSRPHVSKLIEEGKLNATKVGRHRRIQYKDLVEYKRKLIKDSKNALIELMEDSEDLGLYEID